MTTEQEYWEAHRKLAAARAEVDRVGRKLAEERVAGHIRALFGDGKVARLLLRLLP